MAITIDSSNSTYAGVNTTSVTLSHTIANANETLCVFVSCQRVGQTIPTSVTYNGTAMTQAVATSVFSDFTGSWWYLNNPATGTHDIVASYSTTVVRWGIGAISLIGTDQVSTLYATNSGTGNSETPSLALTTQNAGSLVLNGIIFNDIDDLTATGTGQTERFDQDVLSNHKVAGSTQTTTSVGSYTSSWSATGASNYITASIEIKSTSTGVFSNVFIF